MQLLQHAEVLLPWIVSSFPIISCVPSCVCNCVCGMSVCACVFSVRAKVTTAPRKPSPRPILQPWRTETAKITRSTATDSNHSHLDTSFSSSRLLLRSFFLSSASFTLKLSSLARSRARDSSNSLDLSFQCLAISPPCAPRRIHQSPRRHNNVLCLSPSLPLSLPPHLPPAPPPPPSLIIIDHDKSFVPLSLTATPVSHTHARARLRERARQRAWVP